MKRIPRRIFTAEGECKFEVQLLQDFWRRVEIVSVSLNRPSKRNTDAALQATHQRATIPDFGLKKASLKQSQIADNVDVNKSTSTGCP